MRINIKSPDVMLFYNLKDGDVFEFNGHYFMKIPEITTSVGVCNAVRLENGWLLHFAGIDIVRYIDAELTQKGNNSNARR